MVSDKYSFTGKTMASSRHETIEESAGEVSLSSDQSAGATKVPAIMAAPSSGQQVAPHADYQQVR